MLFEEVLEAFLYSRRNGTSTAKNESSATTVKNYERQLAAFVRYQQDVRHKYKFEELVDCDIRAFLEYTKRNPRWPSKATKLSMLRSLRTLLRFVAKDRECQRHEPKLQDFTELMPKIGSNPRREYVPEPLDLKEWRAAFNLKSQMEFRNYIIFSLLLVTGMRLGELVNVEVGHVQLEQKLIFIPKGKSGPRFVPITRDMVRLLQRWLKIRGRMARAKSQYLFTGRRTNQCTVNGLGQMFRKMRETRDLPKLTAHTMRHAFSTFYLENGGDLERLRRITGHTDIRTLQRYLQRSAVGTEAAKEELERVSPLAMLNKVVKRAGVNTSNSH